MLNMRSRPASSSNSFSVQRGTGQGRLTHPLMRLGLVALSLGGTHASSALAASAQATLNCQGETGSILAGNWKLDAAAHNTQAYQAAGMTVARAGGAIDLTLTFDKNPERACFEFDLLLMDTGTSAPVVSLDFTPTSDVSVGKGTFTQSFQAVLPYSMGIGTYNLAVELGGSDGTTDAALSDSATRFIIADAGSSGTRLNVIYNPYDPSSPAYAGAEAKGYLGKSTVNLKLEEGHALSFEIDPFAPEALSLALAAVSGLSYAERQKPASVLRAAREISYSANNNVLWGRWDGSYKAGNTPRDHLQASFDDGKKPWEWTGSTQILKTGGTVKYGQCWVFAGILTTMSRSIGIPTRPTTGYDFVSDSGGGSYKAGYQMTGNAFLHTTPTATVVVPDGKGGNVVDPKQSTDHIWNFHVWNEVFMAGSEKGSAPNWNAFDGTCQEESDGRVQCGPASVEAIKKGTVYDTPFIAGESNVKVMVFLD